MSHVRRFVAEAATYRRPDNAGALEYIGARRVEELAGLAMLRAQLAWESLIEDSYLRYLCGARTASGYQPTLQTPAQRSISAANSSVVGNRRYVSWSSGSTLQRASGAFQHGEPFSTAIGSARQVLDDMVAVRNRIAHASDYAVGEFQGVVRARLGYVPRGMTPGRYLLTPVTYPRASGGLRFIDLYLNTLLGAGAVLVP